MESKAASPRIGRAVLAAFAAALIVKVFVIDFMIAEGNSMTPTIAPGSIIVVNKAAYGLRVPFAAGYLVRWARPLEGDVVVFPSPVGHIAVKRCSFGIDIPKEYFAALGDNAAESYDSRNYGPVPIDAVLGKVVGIR
jgi:signal peptidase I